MNNIIGSVAISLLVTLAFCGTPIPVSSQPGFPTDGSYIMSKGQDWGDTELKVLGIDKVSRTVKVAVPIHSRQRGKRKWQVYARQWYVENDRWIMADQRERDFAVVTGTEDDKHVWALIKLVAHGDGRYRVRLWGDVPGMTGEDRWMWVDENSEWTFPDSRGIKGYELLLDINKGDVAKVGRYLKPDKYLPQ